MERIEELDTDKSKLEKDLVDARNFKQRELKKRLMKMVGLRFIGQIVF